MSRAILIGLDYGTGGAKVCVLSDRGEVLHHAYEEYPQYHDRPGYSEHDATRYWEACVRLVRDSVRAIGSRSADIVAIGLSCALPSLVMVDERGEPVARAINLMDRRAVSEVEEIKAKVGAERLVELTGNRIEDHPALVNMLWLKRHELDVFERTKVGLTVDGFVALKLTGRATLNRSAAAFFGVAYDIHRCEFDHRVLDQIGIGADRLPELVDCAEVVGTVLPEAASLLGIPSTCAVVGGQVDCNAAWIAGGAVEPGDFQLNLGTCGVIGVVHDQTNFIASLAGRQVVNIPYTTDVRRMYSAVAVTMTGGQALRYLRDVIGGIERSTASTLDVNVYDLLTLQASGVPAGSEGLLALPYFMGERTPLWDSSARAAYVGMSLHHGRGHLIRAMLEGVAYAMRWALDVLREGHIVIREPLVFNEGGAKSAFWRRVVTDVLEVRTANLIKGGGAALGDAILAGVGCGVFPGFHVAKQFCEVGEELKPDPRTVELYRAGFAVFQEVYLSLRKPVAALAGSEDPALSAPDSEEVAAGWGELATGREEVTPEGQAV